MEDDEVKDLRERFRIVCRKCGSENVAVNMEQGIDYGGQTGYQSGRMQIGCNDCNKNDWYVWL